MHEVRVLVTGSRNWPTYRSQIILDCLAMFERHMQITLDPDVKMTLVHGDCPTGADAIAKEHAIDLGWELDPYPADWDRFGKSAGFIRNSDMVKEGADVCYAFILNNSSGSTHCAKIAQEAGIETVIYR